MESDRLELREYQTAPAIRLTQGQRDALLSSSVAVRPTPRTSECFDLTPSSEIGAIELPGLSIRIHPKLAIERVMFLISYSTANLALSGETSEFVRQPDLVEAIVAGFVAQVRRAFRPGLLQGYRMEEDALATVRGRIRFETQVGKRLGVAPPIEVRYDNFTIDIEENRIIKAAIDRLRRMRLRSERSRRELRSFGALLSTVSAAEYGHQLPVLAFNRLNERYRAAIRLAELIFRSTSHDLARGTTASSSFLIDMNRVFEDFVVHSLRDQLRLTDREFPQGGARHRLSLDVESRIPLKPDIAWWHGDRCVFVGDVKYKKTKHWSVPNSDLYQIHAYATATDLPGGLLVYAAGEEEPGTHTVRHADKWLDVMALDLAGPPDQVLGNIRRVADRVRSLRAAASVATA